MTISARKITQLIERAESGQIMECDLDAFLEHPQLWRKPLFADPLSRSVVTLRNAQVFWQTVYDDLLGAGTVTVPPLPMITEKQMKSIDRFNFLLMYIPPLIEDQYPEGFVKPAWRKHLVGSTFTPMLLKSTWVAVETIMKPHKDDPKGYPDDRLMAALKRPSRRNTSSDEIVNGLLTEISRATGFPRKGTRLPSLAEWNFIGNLMQWLYDHREMDLPRLGSTRSWEWCQDAPSDDFRLVIGSSEHGGLAAVGSGWREGPHGQRDDNGFRLLVDL